MVGWHHRLSGHEFKQTLGDSEGQGSLARCQSMRPQRVGHDLATEPQLTLKGSSTITLKGKLHMAQPSTILDNNPYSVSTPTIVNQSRHSKN